jgi:hypothetical protein
MPRVRGVKPFKFTLNAVREDDPRHKMKLVVHVTQELLEEADRRDLTGNEMLALAVERALYLREQN